MEKVSTFVFVQGRKNKKTLVLGASVNPQRFSHEAVIMLRQHGHEVVAVGNREGYIGDVPVLKGKPEADGIHTISLYLGPANQEAFCDYLLSLNPARIIFNPGTENARFRNRANGKGIETVYGCTLYMLSFGEY